MNVERRQLSYGNGAPLRLRNKIQLGFKQVKWLAGIDFVAHFLMADSLAA
jgi:DMSO/TMAO reductase YedYZ molybdopterin-dependent catalytic subunit